MRRAADRSEAPRLLRTGVLEDAASRGDDPRCAHPRCRSRMKLEDEKPDVGWATVLIRRHGKVADRTFTVFLCPDHSVVTGERQVQLFG